MSHAISASIPSSEIQETFYNVMIELAFETEEHQVFSIDILRPLMVRTLLYLCNTAVEIELKNKTKSFGFSTVRGKIITKDNVPDEYAQLFNALITVIPNKSRSDIFMPTLNMLVDGAMKREAFANVISKFIKFYGDLTKKLVSPTISVNAIRETFYNIMCDQYFLNIDTLKSDTENLESYIFICLSAYAITSVLSHSRGINGIKLHNNAIVTKENCPQEYMHLLTKLLELKVIFDKINPSDDVIKLIEQTVSMKPDSFVDQRLENLKTPDINNIISMISGLAIKISQLQHFKDIIGNVLKFCLEL